MPSTWLRLTTVGLLWIRVEYMIIIFEDLCLFFLLAYINVCSFTRNLYNSCAISPYWAILYIATVRYTTFIYPYVTGSCCAYQNPQFMIGLTADAGDNFKNRAPIPLAPCVYLARSRIYECKISLRFPGITLRLHIEVSI
jgi:hypothetical protein